MMGFFFFATLMLGIPIVIVMALSTILYIQLSGNTVLYISLPQQLFGGLENYSLLAIPLFVLVGEMMNEVGMTRRLVSFAMIFAGRIKGGLAVVNLLANMFAAAVMGSAVAQVAVMTQALVPEMVAKGYNRVVSVATTLAGSLLAPVIPPSMAFIVYGVLAQVSVSDMFIAGIIPGILLTLSFLIVLFIIGLFVELPGGTAIGFAQAKRNFITSLPSLTVPVLMVSAIVFGFLSPTETAAVAVLHILFVGHFFHGGVQIGHLPGLLLRAGTTSAVVLGLMATANVFGWVLTFEGVLHQIASFMLSMTTDTFIFMLLLIFVLVLIGTVLDSMAAMILLVPILQPVATQSYGVDPYVFGVVVCIALTIGLATPPVGAGLYIAARLGEVSSIRLTCWVLPFLIATILVLVLLSAFPALITSVI